MGSAVAGPTSWGGVARRGAAVVEPFAKDDPRRKSPRGNPPDRTSSTSPSRAQQAWSRTKSSDPEWLDKADGEGGGQERWILDEVRREADGAVRRGGKKGTKAASRGNATREDRARNDSRATATAPDTTRDDLERAVGVQRAARLERRLKDAARAFKRERFPEARKILRSLADEAPTSANVRELLGLTWYREGRWKEAARELETFRGLTGSTEQHPVLADCYRAQKQWAKVERLWDELREDSPGADLVAEGRIVMAGALADQGRFTEAVRTMEAGRRKVKHPGERHFRMAYALGDIHERAGDVPQARELFSWIQMIDPQFADVTARIRALS